MAGEKRILIRVDGDKAMGAGHVYRMRALATALGARGARVAFCTSVGGIGERVLGESDLAVWSVDGDAYVPNEILTDFRPDLVVLDILDTEAEGLAALRAGGVERVLTVDDTGAGLGLADAVINAIVFHLGRYRADDVRAALHEGPGFMILGPELAALRAKAARGGPVKNLLLAFGGTDTHNVTERMLAAVNRLEGPLSVAVNLGPGRASGPGLEAEVAVSPHRVALSRNVPSLMAQFANSDLVLSGGGNILYELAALGIPAAALATEPHERDNIAYWVAAGTALDLGWESAVDFSKIPHNLAGLMADQGRLSEMALRGPELVDGKGTERCLDVIEALLA